MTWKLHIFFETLLSVKSIELFKQKFDVQIKLLQLNIRWYEIRAEIKAAEKECFN